MSFLGEWLRRLVGTAIILGFLELMLPEGELHRFTRVVMGLLVVLILLQPLAGILHREWSFERLLPGEITTPAAAGAAEETAAQSARLSQAGAAALETMRREELRRSLESYCRQAAGVSASAVSIGSNPAGGTEILIELRGTADPSVLKSRVCADYGLSASEIEVRRVE